LIIPQQKASKKVIFNKNINMYNHHGLFNEKQRKKSGKNDYFFNALPQKLLKLQG
jgi:hypothetical protein